MNQHTGFETMKAYLEMEEGKVHSSCFVSSDRRAAEGPVNQSSCLCSVTMQCAPYHWRWRTDNGGTLTCIRRSASMSAFTSPVRGSTRTASASLWTGATLTRSRCKTAGLIVRTISRSTRSTACRGTSAWLVTCNSRRWSVPGLPFLCLHSVAHACPHAKPARTQRATARLTQ